MRGTRVALAAAVAAGAVSLFGGVSSAGAASCVGNPGCTELQFNHAVLQTGGLGYSETITPSTPPLIVQAQLGLPSGTVIPFTIDPADFDFPTISFTNPAPGTIDAHLGSTATGSVDVATG